MISFHISLRKKSQMIPIRSKFINREEYQKKTLELAPSDISVYQQLPWLDVISKGFSAEIKFVCSMGDNETTLALTPFTVKKKGPFGLIGTPLRGTYTLFSGPIFKKNLETDVIVSVISSLHNFISKDFHYFEWGNKNCQSWETSMPNLGYKKSLRFSLLVNLSYGENVVWNSMESRARNMIRKSEKSGVFATTVQLDRKWVKEYFDMLTDTFARQDLKVPHPISFYQELIKLASLGIISCVSAKYEGQMVSAGIFVMDKNRMVFLSGTSNKIGMKTAASSMIQWHAMKLAIKKGITEYDMGGIGEPTIDKFKKSFGGKQISYNRWVRRSWIFSLLEPFALFALRSRLFKRSGI